MGNIEDSSPALGDLSGDTFTSVSMAVKVMLGKGVAGFCGSFASEPLQILLGERCHRFYDEKGANIRGHQL
mgnify:CR=1 FL=1